MLSTYQPGDVTFLLKEVTPTYVSIEEKERLIATGSGHYSEVLSQEAAPTPEYLALFEQQLEGKKKRVAQDVLNLAYQLHAAKPVGELVILSLARAGTPIGVLLLRILRDIFGRSGISHYSVSIIRDKGLDLNALGYVRAKHAADSLFFVDGWTGKGVIGATLTESVRQWNADYCDTVNPHLYVVADIAGTAYKCATRDDYLLPSAILNATVSGLISRTVVNAAIGPDDFHGCATLTHLAPYDRSRHFVDTIFAAVVQICLERPEPSAELSLPVITEATRQQLLQAYLTEFNLASMNYVKPGVGEATRVLLRRKPLLLVVRDAEDNNVAHLLHLASQRGVEVREDPTLPYRALALISKPD